MSFTTELQDEGRDGSSVIIEDDGEVAYAYYRFNGAIAAYVWLYNRSPAPLSIERRADDRPPLNPREFVNDATTEPLPDKDDFGVRFRHSGDDHETAIYVRGKLLAMMRVGESPGWSLGVRRDGPVALKLEV